MPPNKILVFAVAGALVFGLTAGYFLSNRGYSNITIGPDNSSSTSLVAQNQAVEGKPTCYGPNSINLEDIYTKRSVTYRDASGTTGVVFDECIAPNKLGESNVGSRVSKTYCYENPFGSGNFLAGEVAYDCRFGCVDGACRHFNAASSFSYPYPVSWTEPGSLVSFALQKVSLGERAVPLDPINSSSPTNSFFLDSQGKRYNVGDKIYALTLYLKLTIGSSQSISKGDFPSITLRLLLNELGEMAAPNTKQFFAQGGFTRNMSYEREVIFIVPESQKQFYITTGGSTNIFFSITAHDDGNIEAEKLPMSDGPSYNTEP